MKRRRWTLVLLAVAICAAVGAGALFWLTRGAPERRLVVQNITIVYDGTESLAVIVESRRGETTTPWAYAMLGDSGGRLILPQAFKPGADAILRFGLGADLVRAPVPTVTVQSAGLRGLNGAHFDQEKLAFRNARDEAHLALKPDGPPILLRVGSRGGKLVVGESR